MRLVASLEHDECENGSESYSASAGGRSGHRTHRNCRPVRLSPGATSADPVRSRRGSGRYLIQVLQAAITGLSPGQPYTLALATDPSGQGELQSLANFMTNPAGAAIVNTTGPIRQIVDSHSGRLATFFSRRSANSLWTRGHQYRFSSDLRSAYGPVDTFIACSMRWRAMLAAGRLASRGAGPSTC
jgi:hypothetical protein